MSSATLQRPEVPATEEDPGPKKIKERMKSLSILPRRRRQSFLLVPVAVAVLWTLQPLLAQTGPTHPLTGRRVAGLATDANWLERSEREKEEQPERALELIGIEQGLVVADVGAGTGYMTVRLARCVGPVGKVYASDLQPQMLAILKDRARQQQLSNIELVQGALNDARLPAGAIDLALLVDVYHEFWRPQEMLQSIKRALKPGGRLVLLEYRKEDNTIPILYEHTMSVTEVRTEVEAEGFVFDRLIPELPRQHIVVFRKPAS
jgi:SAM-dependent methyltransferase